ncbi:hypothetical protein IKS86_07565 [bacterium]|nr:hypothetical protein [bacterium]
MSKPATSGKYSEIIGKIFLALFVISIFSTFIFWWNGLSNKNALDEETERKFAEVLNENFRRGDIVFTENDWDLDFLKNLKNGVFPVFLDLKNATERSVAMLKSSDDRVFLLLKSEQSHEKYVEKLNLKVLETFKAGKGEVVLAETLFKTVKRTLVFPRDIGKAKKIAFSEGGKSEECRKVSETKWQCSDESWNYVGLTTASFNGNQKQAVWAHPVTGKTLEIVFNVPEKSGKLYFNSVFAESAYRSKNRAPVFVEILADEKIMLKYASPFTSKVTEKTAKIPENTKELTIKLSTTDDRQRHFVFNGYLSDEL